MSRPERESSSLTGLGKPHGLAWVADQGKLFVADGTLAALKVYAGSPLKAIASLPLSDDADDMVYDPQTGLLYVGHGGSSPNRARAHRRREYTEQLPDRQPAGFGTS